jgi:hypothetical protein
MPINISVDQVFFDRKAVIEALGRGKAMAMGKIGAFIRKAAQWSMHRRSGPSAPGSPPNVHQGQLRDLIFFAFDPDNSSVVSGPIPFADGVAPRLNEFGGDVPVTTVTRKYTGNKRYTHGGHYPKRPFMKPALDDSTSNAKLVEAWYNVMH